MDPLVAQAILVYAFWWLSDRLEPPLREMFVLLGLLLVISIFVGMAYETSIAAFAQGLVVAFIGVFVFMIFFVGLIKVLPELVKFLQQSVKRRGL